MRIELRKTKYGCYKGGWYVRVGNASDSSLSDGEALEVVATAILKPNEQPRYLKTAAEHLRHRVWRKGIRERNRAV